MTIRLVCENETSYDPQSGTFTYCDHAFSCDDSLLAKVTRCPKCKNPIRVGSSKRHVWADTGQPVADPNAINQHAMKEQASKGEGGKKKATASSSPSTRTPSTSARGKANRAKPIACPSCGAKLNESHTKCPACLVTVAQPKGLLSSSLIIDRPVGFHRWVLRSVLAGMPPTILGWCAHLLAFAMFVAVCSLAFVGLSRQPAMIISGIAAGIGLVYIYVYFTCYRTCTNLEFPLRWWQQIFWRQILASGRRRNWIDDPALGRERIILDLRGQKVNDALLITMENITVCEILDLEGCPITDKGTQGLHFLKELRCLVLKGTLVSQLEIARLQKSLPNCWLWY